MASNQNSNSTDYGRPENVSHEIHLEVDPNAPLGFKVHILLINLTIIIILNIKGLTSEF
jgi:hypothetical protein